VTSPVDPPGPGERPQFFGGWRDGQLYRRPVLPHERLIVLAFDEATPDHDAQAHTYELRRRRDGRPVLACIGAAPPLPYRRAA
jgi:hypothetical protein